MGYKERIHTGSTRSAGTHLAELVELEAVAFDEASRINNDVFQDLCHFSAQLSSQVSN